VPAWVAAARTTLGGTEPDIDIGAHCSSPFPCPYYDHCLAQHPRADYPVELLPNARKTIDALLAEGYRDLREVPAGRIPSQRLERIRRITAAGKAELDPRARKTLATKGWPRYYLDFETIQFAIPIWAGTRPYQPLPFQWSCHVQQADGRLEHRAFLDLTGELPLAKFLMTLLEALGDDGPVFVWSPFERTQLEALQRDFPESAAAVERVIDRLVDLLPLTREHYYHPDMRGSWSIKNVLPTMDPSLSYDDLDEVKEGGGAMLAYLEAIDASTSAVRREAIRSSLLTYCKRDTEALVKVASFLSGTA
jgi:hypothetical protein